jgi:hypothetical protein
MSKRIIYLKNYQIDKAKWDQLIDCSPNQVIYAFSWFLDEVSPNWQALVYGDYEAVMPLPVKRIGWMKFILQPMFTQQLGVFAQQTISNDLTLAFIHSIKDIIISYNFHHGHQTLPGFQERTNFQLSLNSEYSIISKQYNQNTKRNVAKALKNQLSINKNVSLETFLDFFQIQYGNGLSTNDHQKLKALTSKADRLNKVFIYSCSDLSGEPLAMVLFLIADKRIIYNSAISTKKGYQLSAMFLIVDNLVRHYAGTNNILDFEGSSVEGIARFYSGFGAIDVPYYSYENARILNLLKWIISFKGRWK